MADLAGASIIDADGHVLEPAWLWEEYLEAEFRDRAIRIVPDDQGLEVVLVDGRPFDRLSPGGIALIGSMGEEGARPEPGIGGTWRRCRSAGATRNDRLA